MKKNLKELFDLTGKVIVLTGSERLLGQEYKDILQEAGAKVIELDIKISKNNIDYKDKRLCKTFLED